MNEDLSVPYPGIKWIIKNRKYIERISRKYKKEKLDGDPVVAVIILRAVELYQKENNVKGLPENRLIEYMNRVLEEE